MLVAVKLHRVWHDVEELDLALVRTVLMHCAVKPNCMEQAWLHNNAALLVYKRIVGRAPAAGFEPCGPGSDQERNLACSATMTVSLEDQVGLRPGRPLDNGTQEGDYSAWVAWRNRKVGLPGLSSLSPLSISTRLPRHNCFVALSCDAPESKQKL